MDWRLFYQELGTFTDIGSQVSGFDLIGCKTQLDKLVSADPNNKYLTNMQSLISALITVQTAYNLPS